MTDPGSRTRFIGRVFEAGATLANGETLIIEGSEATTNAVEIQQIAFGDDCTITLEADTDQDGTFDKAIDVDTFTGVGISQGNEIRLSGDIVRFVLTNTGTSADFIVTGEEMAP